MGNICSTRDEGDLRQQQQAQAAANGGNQPSPGGGKNQKNVFKTNPKGKPSVCFTLMQVDSLNL